MGVRNSGGPDGQGEQKSETEQEEGAGDASAEGAQGAHRLWTRADYPRVEESTQPLKKPRRPAAMRAVLLYDNDTEEKCCKHDSINAKRNKGIPSDYLYKEAH